MFETVENMTCPFFYSKDKETAKILSQLQIMYKKCDFFIIVQYLCIENR